MFLKKIEINARRFSDKVAVKYGAFELSYKELFDKAYNFANLLKQNGLVKGNAVILYHSRNQDLLYKILGIFLSGGIYVPIDKKFPEGRLAEISEQLNPFAIVEDDKIDYRTNCSINDSEELAYILFTSGSTGKPKGVCLGYDNLNAFLDWVDGNYSEKELCHTLLSTSISFDLSIFEIFAPLIKGTSIILIDKVTDLIEQKNIFPTIINTVPSAVSALLESQAIPSSVITVNIAGEPLRQSLVHDLYDLGHIEKVYNLYGPTECTTYATCMCVSREYDGIFASIGRHLENFSKIIIVDENLAMVKNGQKGEILIGGKCVGKGYYQNTELSEEKFITVNGEFFYRTGDIGAFENDVISFYGRIDSQIKMRGYRIELLEIERRLLSIEGIKSAVVIFLDEYQEIVACVSSKLEKVFIQTEMKKFLPDYMMPNIMIFDALPLNQNGKIDRIQLKTELNCFWEKDKYNATNIHPLLEIAKKVLKKNNVYAERSFFEQGGHSLLTVQFFNEIKKNLKWDISIQEIFEAESLQQLIEKFESNKDNENKLKEIYPWEKRFIAFEKMNPGLGVYNLAYAFEFNYQVDVQKLQDAVQRLQNLYLFLTERFIIRSEKFYKSVGNAMQLQSFDTTSKEAINDFAFKAFDFFGGPLIRFGLFSERIMVISAHHCVVDGRSFQVILDTLFKILNNENVEKQNIVFWNSDKSLLKEFRNIDCNCEMRWPRVELRPLRFDYCGKTKKLELNKSDFSDLSAELKGIHCNFANFVFAIYALTLSKFCRQKQFNIGVPFGNRLNLEEESSLGCFVNVLPISFDFEKLHTIQELIEYCRNMIWEYLGKQRVQFDDLLDYLKVPTSLSTNPIFQAVFVSLPNMEYLCAENNISEIELDFPYAKYDCTLQITESNDKIILGLEYATSVIDEQKASLLLNLIKENMFYFCKNLNESTDQFKYIHQNISRNSCVFPKSTTITDEFALCCAKYPDNIAVKHLDEKITYKELDDLSSAVANTIAESVASEDVGIAVRMNVGIDLIVAILGILKAGKMYVPIDPIVPDSRANYILADSNTKCVITNICDCQFNCKVIQYNNIDFSKTKHCICKIDCDDYAYMIYTTGTTGNPKGIRINHHNVVRLFKATESQFKFCNNDIWCLLHSYGFDFSVWEIFGALLFGGTLVIPTKNEILSPAQLYNFIEKNNVTILNQTPSALKMVLKEWDHILPNLKYIISGGEALESSVIREWSLCVNFPISKLINMYGITETTVHNTYYGIKGNENCSVIGTPLKDLDIYLIDENKQVVSEGLKGEIIVAGDGVSDGYYNKAAITKEKFINIPEIDERTFYRSGDLAIKNNGNLVYLGRIDRQVQLRGFRIELAEIELKAFEYSRKQCVAALEKIHDEDSLVLYIKSEHIYQEIDALRLFLKQNLPPYMIPNYIFSIEKFPLNMNGKIDFVALRSLRNFQLSLEKNDYQISPTEDKIKTICEEELEIKISDLRKNFFELGAHSFSLIKIAKRLNDLGYSLDVIELFTYSNIHDLASFLEQSGGA